MRLSDLELLELQFEASKVVDKFSTYNLEKLEGLLFPKQKNFIIDPHKRKAAICSRRAGKSTGVAIDLCKSLLENTEGDLAYITLTRANAKKILFNPIEKLNKTNNLGLVPNRADLTFTDPKTNNTLYLTGAHTEDEVEKLRGLKLKKIVLDEVASFRSHLNYMVEEVLEPTLIDTDGTMMLIGTPSANPSENYFFKVTSGIEKGWSVHKWTILDNPFIPHAKAWLENYRTRKGWQLDHPVYLREWLGQWTFDTDSLVYKYNPNINDYDTINHKDLNYIIGVDLGFDDAFTICVNAYSYADRHIWTIDQFKKSGMIPSQMAATIKYFKDKYNPIRTVADHGGLGKAICEEFNQRYQLNIYPAEKSKKAAYIEIANGDLVSGLVKIKDGSLLADEMKVHQWDPDRDDKEDDRTPNDLCDAWLYSYRECKHYLGEVKPTPPEMNTPEFFDAEAAKMLENEIEDFERQQKEAELYG